MLDWITHLITSLNYWGITLLMLLENLFPPIPSELIMPLAGFTVTQGKLNLIGVIGAGTVGSILGALPWYSLGRRVNEKRLKCWIDRHGQWLTLSGADIENSQHWFRKYGNFVVLLGRLIPGIRTYISIPAGFEKMPWLTFLLYSLIGTACWNSLLTYAGVLLGKNYQRVERFLGPVSGMVLVGLLILCGFWVMRRRTKHKR